MMAHRGRLELVIGCVSVLAAASLAWSSTGLPSVLALAALGLSLVLLWARSGSRPDAEQRTPVRLARLVAIAGGVVGLALIVGRYAVPRGAERLPYEAPRVDYLPSATRACLEKPDVEVYLRSLHESLLGAWDVPADVPAGRQVLLEFTLLPTGEVSNPVVVSSTHQGLGRIALEALTRAAPFGRLGPDVSCLAGAPVRLALSNPRG